MRLSKFSAKGIHGHLAFNLTFNQDLTFLTGINGSGKTTALNAIIALITPDLITLASLAYETMSIFLEDEGKKLNIIATKTDEKVTLTATGCEAEFSYRPFPFDPDSPASRQIDSENEYYREILSGTPSHPVLRLIAALPTPMFLGLDRRAGFEAEERRARPAFLSRPSRIGRNVFSASLARSISDAADLAETKYRDALISAGDTGEELQREMILSLLTPSPEGFLDLAVPTAEDMRELSRIRGDVGNLSRIFRLPLLEVQQRVLPFLDELQKNAKTIPKDSTIDEIFKGDSEESPAIDALFKWSSNKSHLKRIKVISDTVAEYNERRKKKMESTSHYLKLVNTFLADSGKKIEFSPRGYIHVSIDGIDDPKPISSLSSGEAQIFVILTQLVFNTLAQNANVFIIDEPELSLHVRWQELFVESVRSANPNIQYIMATHSPSIILDGLKYCQDIVRKTRAKAKNI